jgi:DNA-binding NtrC family response regulator
MPDAYDRLKAYQYPGNVRELRNILFIAATHSKNREIDAALIDSVMNNLPNCNGEHEHENGEADNVLMPSSAAGSLKQDDAPVTLKDIEAMHIRELLVMYQGNRKKVADTLGISERSIYRKIKDFGIN